MNDSRRQGRTLRAGLLFSALAAAVAMLGCGSGGGGASSEGSGPRERAAERGSASAARRASQAAPASGEVVGADERPPLVEEPGPGAFFCTRDSVAFDLSQLQPSDNVPPAFWFAWVYAQRHAELPGFVVAYKDTVTGPVVGARVGAVRKAGLGEFAFMDRLPPTPVSPVRIDPKNRFHVSSANGLAPFMTAFGSERVRQGFVVTHINIEGTLDSSCSALRDVVVSMMLRPEDNKGLAFGNMTVAEALGEPNMDSDGDGKPDFWSITMVAKSLPALKFRQ